MNACTHTVISEEQTDSNRESCFICPKHYVPHQVSMAHKPDVTEAQPLVWETLQM